MSQTAIPAEVLPPAPPPRKPRSINWPKWSVVLAALLLVGIPVGVAVVPRELAHWYLAGAQQKFLAGDLEGMQESLATALSYNPESLLARVEGAEWHLELGDAKGALVLANEAVEMAPDRYKVYEQRSLIYQKLGRSREAIDDAQKSLEVVKRELANLEQREGEPSKGAAGIEAQSLNTAAYARAVANVELPEALAQIDQAIKLDEPNAAFLDTRGFIHYLSGNLPAARSDLDEAVTKAERMTQEVLKALERTGSLAHDERASERQRKKIQRNLAVIYYHRGLVLEKQGEKDAAEKDFARVRELGETPGPDLY